MRPLNNPLPRERTPFALRTINALEEESRGFPTQVERIFQESVYKTQQTIWKETRNTVQRQLIAWDGTQNTWLALVLWNKWFIFTWESNFLEKLNKRDPYSYRNIRSTRKINFCRTVYRIVVLSAVLVNLGMSAFQEFSSPSFPSSWIWQRIFSIHSPGIEPWAKTCMIDLFKV